jgi:subtilase family serine protease
MPSSGPFLVLPKPDLTFSFAGYTLNSCAIQGKYTRMKISATVRNEGKGQASVDDWGIAVTTYASVPLDVPSTYTGVKPVAHGPKTLNPGASFSVTLDLIIGPATNNQSYPVYVQVDPSNKVTEANETNNNHLVVNVPPNKQYCTAK